MRRNKGFNRTTICTWKRAAMRGQRRGHWQGRRLHHERLEERFVLSMSPWTPMSVPVAGGLSEQTDVRALDYDMYSLDVGQVRDELLQGAINEIAVPNPDGGLEWFTVAVSTIMSPELAAQFPEIRTFRGQGVNDPAATVSFDITPAGFHAQVLSPNGSFYIDPYYHLNDRVYAVYSADNTFNVPSFTECLDCDCAADDADKDPDTSTNDASVGPTTPVEQSAPAVGLADELLQSGGLGAPGDAQSASGSVLRTYRLAVAATGEYTAFQGGTVALGQAAIVTAINRVSGIYETELSIRLQLVGNNSSLVYTNAATDPYTNDNPDSLLTENQANIDSVIGSGNYDVGHVFSTGGGGLAGLGVVGRAGQKAQGETGLDAPTGDAFYVDYVAHELGHQFGGNHTFNGDSGSCSGANRNASTAYEPGSGTTIMAYAGICGNDDLQPHSDPYFHSVSLDEIIAYVDSSIPSVGTRTSTGNAIPTVDAGINYTIPTQTPFTVTAVGSDANGGDVLTYDWEERDLGAQSDLAAADNGTIPLFRAFSPTTDSSRTFPQLANILSNTPTISEKLPTVARTMHLRVTVRDNRVGGGAVNSDDMTVNVVNTGAAFAITSQNAATTWQAQSTQTVTWNVAGTTANGINTAFVNILLSTDGGNTFTTVLAASTPNDGSQTITVPNISTSTARIKVQAVGNIFFDISNANITISDPVPGIDLVASAFSINTPNLIASGGAVNASVSLVNQGTLPSGAFDVKFYLSDDATINPVTDTLLTLDPSSPFYDVAEPAAYHVAGGVAPFGLHSATVRLLVPLNDPFVTDNQYFLGMYVDADANVAETNETNNANNGTGIDEQGVTYSLTFAGAATITIPDSGVANPYPSTINISGLAGKIGDVNVSLLGVTHTFPDDIDILLVGPAGQKIILMSDVGGSNDINGINLVFDDQAAASLSNSGQLASGTFKPTNNGTGDTFAAPAPAGTYGSALSAFNGTVPNGTWSLYVVDDQANDTGSIAGGWSLTFTLVNTAPTNPIDVPQPAIDEDIAAAANVGRSVLSLVAGSGSTDTDGNSLGVAVTAVDNSHGQWQYEASAGGAWQDISSATATAARLLGPAYYVRFVPGSEYNSSVATDPTFGFKIWDQTFGVAGAVANTTASNAFSSLGAVSKIVVNPVNDAPLFTTPSGPVVASEDAGPVSVGGFATGIAAGPATATDESGQALTFVTTVASTTGTLAFDVAPSINPLTGTLSFTAVPNTNGTAAIDVVLKDNGSNTAPNVNTSSMHEFIISVTAVDDAPIFALSGAVVAADEDAGSVSIAGFATDMTPGPAAATDEAGQVLTFLTTVAGTTGTLAFDVAPSIDPLTGNLSFTAAANTNGTATIDVELQDSGSGVTPNVNASAVHEFTINVAAVNDEEVLAINTEATVIQHSLVSITSSSLQTTDIDDTSADLLYVVSAGPSHGLLVVGGAPATQFSQQQIDAGAVSYQNDGSANTADSFDFTVDDGKGAASGGTFHLAIRPNAGDYDQNLLVDAADYVLWRKTAGTTGVVAYSGADGNGDTTIEENDYTVWQANFNVASGAGTGLRAVGEEFGTNVEQGGNGLVYFGESLAGSLAPGTVVSERLPYGMALGTAQEGQGLLSLLVVDRAIIAKTTGTDDDASDGHDYLSRDQAVDEAFAELGGGLAAAV